jgi:hypothetical protein
MAVLSNDKTYVTVERGDTLSEIARDFSSYSGGKTYKQLASINNIPNPNLIYVDQKIILTTDSPSATPTNTTNTTSQAIIKQFGIQSNSDNTLFATWTWDKSNTDHYEVEWTYDTGDSVWFIGSDTTTEYKQSTYSIPANAKRVRVRVKPISETYTSNDKETTYWTASWSSYKIHNTSDNPPKTPGTPEVEIDKYKLTASLDNLSVNATQIQFQVVKDDSTVFKTGTATIATGHVSFSCTVNAGGKYKVRCRSCKDGEYSEWSAYSSNVTTIPAASTGITSIKASSDTSVSLEWAAANSATSYDLEYTTKKIYFDGSNQTTTVNNIEFTRYELTGLESGQEYFFRVRAVNEKGESAWSDIKSVVIGKKPSAPTTWSSSTKVITGEDLTLYWVHNSVDGSSQTYAQLELIVDGGTPTSFDIKNTTNEDEKDKTSSYVINTSAYVEGTVIQWRVRTAGVTNQYGEWSVQRQIDIYAPPTLELKVTDVDGNILETLTSFPAYVYALAGPNTQIPIGYHVTVTSNEVYETVDPTGNVKMVNIGEEIYSKYFDITSKLLVELSASNIDLENNVSYTVTCTVSMNSGLTVEESTTFNVAWDDVSYEPNAEISIDKETLVAYIRPYCAEYTPTYYSVTQSGTRYIATTEKVAVVWGEELIGVKTTTGEQVYSGILEDGTEIYYYKVQTGTLVEGVTLSVYRREFDGTFVELATGISNSRNTTITDPHPALDYARYRIVAITDATGAVSFCDLPGYPVGEHAVIIQWNEEWSNFDVSSEDELAQPPWSGSMLRLPYNIDVSDSRKPDVALVEYAGRTHPVSYYGTHVGETATWNMDIVKSDKETLYALRRLSIWMGDVYVREPSGSGYWANITVSFSQKHRELTIPVTLNIVRVEGGV